jgi:hypothetical protein
MDGFGDSSQRGGDPGGDPGAEARRRPRYGHNIEQRG